MAQHPEAKEERELKTHTFKNFQAVNTTNARTACPKEALYDLVNAQPIGASNIHSIPGISALIHDYGVTVYAVLSVNLNGIDYMIQLTTDGNVWAYNQATGASTRINGAHILSGSGGSLSQFSNTQVLIIDTSGYFSWDGVIADPMAVNSSVTGAPANGNCIAVYQNRVWITVGRLLYYSAPGSFVDFTTANGGGFSALLDPALRSRVMALFAANGYLYYFGLDSVNAISDVYVPSGSDPPAPTYTDLNLSAIIGTDQPYSIMAYGRLILFANKYGIWQLYGTSITSISGTDPNNQYGSSIDGTYQYVNFVQVVSGAQVNVNNFLCAGFLLKQVGDPTYGTRTIVAMYQGNAAGGKWWFADYGALTHISYSLISGAPVMYGYIGGKMFQLFADTTTAPAATVSTSLWDFEDPIVDKQAIRAGVGITIYKPGQADISLYIDTPQISRPMAFGEGLGAVSWQNKFGQYVQWVNNSGAVVAWSPSTFQTLWGRAQESFSKYIGMTLKTAPGTIFELNSFLLDYKTGARWKGN